MTITAKRTLNISKFQTLVTILRITIYEKMTLYMETLHNCLNRSYHLKLSLMCMLHEVQVPD